MAEKQDEEYREEGVVEEEDEEGEVRMRRPSISADNDQSVVDQPWYWPHISRGEADRILAGQPDGTFLVRDCTVPGDFTLTVRKDGCNKCVRIYRQAQKGYSLSPAESNRLFYTLTELVDYYRTHSLAHLNKRLGIHLSNAVCKPATAPSNQYGVFKELYDLSLEVHSSQNRLSLLQQHRLELDTKLKMVELETRALQQVQQIYYDNMVRQADCEAQLCRERTPPGERGPSLRWLHRECSLMLGSRGGHSAPQAGSGGGGGGGGGGGEDSDMREGLTQEEQRRWTENTALVLSRHKAVTSRLEELKIQSRVCSLTLRGLESDLQYVELSLVNLKNRMHELVRQMMDLGCQKEFVCRVLDPPGQGVAGEFDVSTWLVECTREEAVSRLQVLPHGAFLMRRKDYTHFPYALSVVVHKDDDSQPTVHHCFIVQPKGRGLGFNAALAVFPTIEDLVLRHRQVSLRHYFSTLDVRLSFPVGCHRMLQLSLESSHRHSSVPEV